MKYRLPNKANEKPFGQPGDVFFTRGTGDFQSAIRWVETGRGEADSWANHTGVVTKPGYFVPPNDGEEHALAHVSEALWHIEHHEWWGRHRKSQGYAVAVFRPLNVNNDDVENIVTDALSRTGQRYAWWRIPGFLFERLTRIPFSKAFFLKNRNVCSNHMGHALMAGGVGFGMDPKEMDPDEAMDYCTNHPDEFKFVGWAVVPGQPPTETVMSAEAAGILAAFGGA